MLGTWKIKKKRIEIILLTFILNHCKEKILLFLWELMKRKNKWCHNVIRCYLTVLGFLGLISISLSSIAQFWMAVIHGFVSLRNENARPEISQNLPKKREWERWIHKALDSQTGVIILSFKKLADKTILHQILATTCITYKLL